MLSRNRRISIAPVRNKARFLDKVLKKASGNTENAEKYEKNHCRKSLILPIRRLKKEPFYANIGNYNYDVKFSNR